MELRHVVERRLPLLLRSSPGPRHGTCSSSATSRTRSFPSIRSFTSSQLLRADQRPSQQPATASSTDQSQSSSETTPASSTQKLDDLLSSRLNFARGSQPATSSPPLNRNPNMAAAAEPRPQASSVQELLQQIKAKKSASDTPTANRSFGFDRGSNALGLQSWNRRSTDTLSGRTQAGPEDSSQTIAAMLRRMPGGDLTRATVSATAAPPLRLNASLGRTVKVEAARNMDLGRAFRQLDVNLARNRVRADSARQRFHERPGLRRKRLKSERWRRRFKEGFQDVVRRVEELRRLGW